MKTKQQLLREATTLKQKLAKVEKQINQTEVKRMQQLAGILKEEEHDTEGDLYRTTGLRKGEYSANTPAARGRDFRGNYKQQDAQYRREKALKRVDYGSTSAPTTISSIFNYFLKASGSSIFNIAQASATAEDFIKTVTTKVPKLNNPGSINTLNKYYKDIKR